MTPNRPLPRLANYWGNTLRGMPIGTQRVDGKDFEVYGFDADVYHYLRDLAIELRRNGLHPERLICLRADFRRITRRSSPIGLLYSLTAGDALQKRLAVWLLGRMNWPRGISFLQKCPPSAPLDLQFEIARAMKRLRAWSELATLELQVRTHWQSTSCQSETYRLYLQSWLPRLRRMCELHVATDYAARLANFIASGVSPAHRSDAVEHSRQTLWYQEPVGPGQRPKSRWLIRRILERIRMVVRGCSREGN